MTSAEEYHQDESEEHEINEAAKANVDALVNALHTDASTLATDIEYQHFGDEDIHDAVQDVRFSYDDTTTKADELNEETAVFALAKDLPSEEDVPPTVTAIRLLSKVGISPGFKLDAYPVDVAYGVNALVRYPGEDDRTYYERLDRRPELHLVATDAKLKVIKALEPVVVALGDEKRTERKGVFGPLYNGYEHALPHIENSKSRENRIWAATLRKGILRGRDALGLV